MLFYAEDNASNAIQFTELNDGIFAENREKRMTEHFIEKDLGNRKRRPTVQEGQTESRAYCSEYDQTQTHRSTRQISRETGLTRSSVVQIIHHNLGLKWFYFVYRNVCLPLLLVFLTAMFHKVV